MVKEEKMFNLTGSMVMLLSLLGTYGVWKFLIPIFVAMVGSVYQTILSGDIPVPEAFNNTTAQLSTDTANDFITLNSSDAIIIGLISLSVLLTLFWPIIGRYLGGLGKKGSGNGMV